MIKKFLLAVMLIWCATEGMAQNLIKEKYDSDPSQNDLYDKYWYDIYDDGTAILVDISAGVCASDVYIPATVRYNEKEYTVVKVADQVFSMFHKNMAIITIDENVSPDLVLGSDPLGYIKDDSPEDIPDKPISVYVPPCVDASKWKNDFDVFLSMPSLVDAVITEPLETTYNGNKPFSLTTPYIVNTTDYTLSITKLQPLNDKGEYWSISAIDFTVIDNNNNNEVCHVTGDYLEIDKEILKVNLADITEIKQEDLLLETNSKFYPVPNISEAVISHVRTGGSTETYSDDYVVCKDDDKKYIPMRGLAENDTLCVECDYNFVYNEDGVTVNFSIPSNANIKGNYGPGYHFSSQNYRWTLNLNKDFECKIPLTDPYPVFVNKTPEDKYEEITGTEPINHSTQTWTDYWFEVNGKRYEHGFFINYNEEDFANLTKTYDGTTDISASTLSVTLKLKQRFNPTIGAVNRISSDWLAFDPQAYCIEKQIDIDCSLAFDNPNVGTDKTIKLTITPTDDFYKGLIGGSYSVTLNAKGTITPIQLDDVLEVRDAIYNALGKERNKPYDGSSMLVPNHKTITLDKEDTGLPDNVQVSLSNLQYFGQDGEWKPSAEHGKHTIVMDLELVLNDNDNTNNYCFFRRDNETYYTENWLYQGEDKYTGEIIPVEINLTEDMFYLTFPKERPFDGTNLVYDHLGKIVNPDNPQMFLANPEYMINGNFQITNALYKSAEVTDPDPNSIILTIKNLSGNYIINNLGDGNTFAISGNITFQRQYNSEDASAEIKTAEFSKDGHKFIITDAKFADNSAGNEKQIDVTIKLNDNNPNYELKNSKFNISGGKIWDYATIALNNNKFAEGKATIGTDIIATATYNGQNIEGTVTYNPAAGTQLTQGTHEITATFNSACGYIESSTQIFTVEVNGSAIIIKEESIQQKDNQTEYCINGVNGLELKYTKISGDINRFKIEIEGEEKLSEAMSDNKGERINDTIIYVNIPSDAKPGIYHGNIQFFGDDVVSDIYPFEITVYMPKSIVKYLYHNVIFVDNHENLFSDYQWYKNGEKIDGATRQYYYEKVLDGNYYVVCKTNSGIQLKSCPVEGDLSAKLSVSSVKVYPNPAKANIPFNLELVGGNGNYSGAEMMIYNNSGNLVKHITNITDIITLTLPQGNYSGALFFNGEKTGFKIIVK